MGWILHYLRLTVFLAVGTIVVLGSPAWSNTNKDERGNVAALAKETKVTINHAVKTASEKVNGTVVGAELEKKHGRAIWEVEVLGTDGMVTEVHIDAATGAVVDTEAKGMKKEKKKDGKCTGVRLDLGC
jgi:hypothetical protein